MPRSKKSSRALDRTSSSCQIPTVMKTGLAPAELGAGLAVCAATQMEQDDSVWLG
jgi:hypothetical protein